MNESQLPSEFLKALLAQDIELNSAAFDDQRRQILDRLAEAEKQERRSRRVAMMTCGACFALLLILSSAAVVSHSYMTPENWPNWLVTTVALVFILAPLSALMICSLYFFRYRRGFVRLQKEAYQQTLLALPRQIKELRQNLEELRGQHQAPPNRTGPSHKSQQGFTVMELLVVVGILGILASLLFPALSSAKSRVRATSCKNNLRQIGAALSMYEGDYHYFPGAGDAGIVQAKQNPWTLPSSNSWVARITPYLRETTAVFSCPDYDPRAIAGSIRHDAFGYNAGGSAAIYTHMEANLGLGFGKSNFVSSSVLKAPSDMVAVGDVQFVDSVWCNIITANKAPIGTLLPIPSRHAGGANMLFTDSHLEWAKQINWIADRALPKSRWNNDHLPHPETW
jgi:prepilin-type N-terminal cleavage/methylation domain-containing protein/prepilin-type processing-associated H-X9-DG protein